jgi:hypothetical protein
VSDKRISETGKNVSEDAMSTALMEAAQWADELMEAETKSRREKEYVVRDRLAGKIGVNSSYLFRLQYKIEEMNDVKGSVYRALMIARKAYDSLCERVENAADAMEKELREIEENNAVHKGPVPNGAGVVGASKAQGQEMR